MQPLLAAVDGTVTKISLDDQGISGDTIRITGDDGWYYNYFHVNNDTPGTDDGHATPEWQVEPGLTVGSRVRAGQVIGYMGDSGNAEHSVPHLHFEIRTPDRTPVNPYHSLVAAQQRETCAPNAAWTNTPLEALSPSAVAVIPLADGGRWVIDVDGRLHAEGPAARSAVAGETAPPCSRSPTPRRAPRPRRRSPPCRHRRHRRPFPRPRRRTDAGAGAAAIAGRSSRATPSGTSCSARTGRPMSPRPWPSSGSCSTTTATR